MTTCKRCNKSIHTSNNRNVPENLQNLQGICHDCLTTKEKQIILESIKQNKDIVFQTQQIID